MRDQLKIRERVNRFEWLRPSELEMKQLERSFSRRARCRGKAPDQVFVMRSSAGKVTRSAIQYLDDNLYQRWGIQNYPASDIIESWSTIMDWLRPLIGDSHAIEIYPREFCIVDTAPIRWFWVLPDDLPFQCDLKNT